MKTFKVFINILEDGTVFIQARVADKEGNVGDFSDEITIGESLFGVPYAAFISNGEGVMEIKGEVQ